MPELSGSTNSRLSVLFQSHRVEPIILALALFAPAIAWSDTSGSQSIVIPAIISRWKIPGEEGKPEITIDEVMRCMGTTSNAGDLYESVNAQGRLIERESIEINSAVTPLQNERAEIEGNAAKNSENKKSLEEKAAIFKRRGEEMERLRVAKLTQTETKEANAKIAKFNEDLAKFKKQIATFNTSLTLQQEKVLVFNAKISNSNEKVTQFNSRVERYKADAERLTQLVAQHKEKCTGERRLIK